MNPRYHMMRKNRSMMDRIRIPLPREYVSISLTSFKVKQTFMKIFQPDICWIHHVNLTHSTIRILLLLSSISLAIVCIVGRRGRHQSWRRDLICVGSVDWGSISWIIVGNWISINHIIILRRSIRSGGGIIVLIKFQKLWIYE